MIKEIKNWLSGKKTYILTGLLAIYAISGYLTGHISGTDTLKLLWDSGVVSTLRAAVAKLS